MNGGTKPHPELVKDHFLHEGRLSEEQALFILTEVTALMSREPNMLVLSGPITGMQLYSTTFSSYQYAYVLFLHFLVCGDIHGQYVRAQYAAIFCHTIYEARFNFAVRPHESV